MHPFSIVNEEHGKFNIYVAQDHKIETYGGF